MVHFYYSSLVFCYSILELPLHKSLIIRLINNNKSTLQNISSTLPGSTKNLQTTVNQTSVSFENALFSNETTDETTFPTSLRLARMDTHQAIKPFRKAKLWNCNGDLTKRWFIEYYVWDEKTNKLVRKKHYKGINKYKTAAERTAEGNRKVREINKLLDQGYYQKMDVPIPNKPVKKNEPNVIAISEAFEKILSVRKQKNRKKTYQKLKTLANIFQAFIQPKVFLHQITHKDFIAYSDYLFTERQVSATTRNDHIGKLGGLFNEMIEREWITTNPTKDIKKAKEEPSTKNVAYLVNNY